MVFLSLGEYTFSIRPSLGFGVVNDDPTLGGADGVVFVDSFPHVDAGYMPASPWHGEDALVHLFDRSGTAFSNTSIPPSLDGLSFGDLLLFGAGTAADPQGVMHSTRLLLNGTIDDLKPASVPEPATLALLGVGMLAAFARRRRAHPVS
jgi:hypothetical protein